MPKKTKPHWANVINPDTKQLNQFPLNRAARRAFKKIHGTDMVPPPITYPKRNPNV